MAWCDSCSSPMGGVLRTEIYCPGFPVMTVEDEVRLCEKNGVKNDVTCSSLGLLHNLFWNKNGSN